MRLNRYLAAAGLGSRRSCDQLISSGAVVINGTRIENLATQVNEDDDVRVNGRQIHTATPVTLLLHKPRGFVVTRSDERGRRTVYDLVPPEYSTLFHVGRLDKESEGLLLMTNDGALAQRLTHPSHTIEKEYEVVVDRPFGSKDAAALLKGTWIEGSVARVQSVRTLGPTKIAVILHQGLKRQIRVMLGQLGFKVQRLVRVRIGPLTLRGVKPGSYRVLRPEDLEALRKAAAAPKTKKPATPRKPKVLKFTNFTVVPASAKRSQEASPAPKKPRKTSRTEERVKHSQKLTN
jgi:23S rRNA pseudouridine2605 synthase